MSIPQTFAQRGNTRRLFTALTSPMANAMQITVAAGFPPANNYIITNSGPAIAYVGYGPDSATAIANASVPAVGDSTGTFCFVVKPGQRSVEAKPDAWFAAVTETGSANLMITPGHGLVDGFGEGLDTTEVQEGVSLIGLLAYSLGEQQELLKGLLAQLLTITDCLKQGHNVSDDVEVARSENEALIN